MTKTEFLHSASHLIFKEVAKGVNQLVGLSKTSAMVANLFATLPMQVEVRHMSNQPKPSKKLNALNEFVHAYIKHDDSTKVYIAFFCASEKQLNRIYKAIQKHPEFFAFLYMREALKLTRLMNTKTHYTMMSNIIGNKLVKSQHYAYSIRACEYAVNDTIQQLFKGSSLTDKFNKIMENQNYCSSYSNKSEMDILIDLLKDIKPLELVELDEDYSYNEETNQILGKGLTNGSIPVDESTQTNLGESLTSQFGSMARGTGSAAIFGEFFEAKKVKTGWFKKLSSKFSRDVYEMTNTFRSQWSSLNITYRNHFKAPKAQYEDNKLAVVLSVDHSGSVGTEGLQKLLYLFEKHSSKITQLTVLIHDTEVVKEFLLEDDYDIKSNPHFKEALAHRFAVGGTSHYDVFRRIDELIKTKSIDPTKTIYISFSDNYSDIPTSWDKFKSLKEISTVFLAPEDNPVNVKGTTDIAMS